MTSRWMQPGAVQKLLDTYGRPDASLSHQDGKKGFDFYWFGICTESSWNTEIAFLKLVTLKLVIILFFFVLEK